MTNVTYFFTPLVLIFIPEHCHDIFFHDLDFFDVPCLKIGISKALGYAIILGSAMVKIPQIINLLTAKSAVGLSLNALLAEILAVCFTMAYSVHKEFPFSAWGECLFLSIQNSIILFLVFWYGQSHMAAFASPVLLVVINYVLCSSLAPIAFVTKLQQSVLLIMIISRFLQIWENYSNGHTGQLSIITSILLAGGALARVFTAIQETGDINMVMQFVLSCALNCLVLSQIVWYWNATKEIKAKEE